jgi:hypothetical protein
LIVTIPINDQHLLYNRGHRLLGLCTEITERCKAYICRGGWRVPPPPQHIPQWKRLGYSLLLRIGMRYSKSDPGKAKTIVQAAVTGGVMQSNADNCYLKYNNTYPNLMTQQIQQLTNTYYLAEPFVTQLKTTLDINNGLSHNQVNCIYKDSKGFMWFGTIAGLNRYDGYTFKVFKQRADFEIIKQFCHQLPLNKKLWQSPYSK